MVIDLICGTIINESLQTCQTQKITCKSRCSWSYRIAAAAAIAFLKEEYPNNLYVEQEVYKYLKEEGFEFDMSEDYGEPLVEGTYKAKYDIYNLDGDKIINSDEDIIYTNTTHTIMGYDVFKYKDVYLTTEDLYA